MALNNIYSFPSSSNGVTVGSGGSAWAAGTYVELTTGISTPIAIIGTSFLVADNAGNNANLGILLEVSTGASSAESVKIQIPTTSRVSTNAGHIKNLISHNLSLPEPYYIAANTRIALRGYTSDTVGGITFNNIKIFYYEKAATVTNTSNFLFFF